MKLCLRGTLCKDIFDNPQPLALNIIIKESVFAICNGILEKRVIFCLERSFVSTMQSFLFFSLRIERT